MSGVITVWVAGRLPGLNLFRKGKWDQIRESKAAKERVHWAQDAQCVSAIPTPTVINVLCVEPDLRRDEDNVVGGARKLGQDALKGAGCLPDDSQKHVTGGLSRAICAREYEGLCVGTLFAFAPVGLLLGEMIELARHLGPKWAHSEGRRRVLPRQRKRVSKRKAKRAELPPGTRFVRGK